MAAPVVPLTRSIHLAGVPESVGTVREFVRDALGEDHPSTDVALLLASELVANSVRHSDSGRRPDGRVTVTITVDDGAVHVDVADEGSAANVPRVPGQPDELRESGRGLWLVQELSAAWGWEDIPTGRLVWFRLPTW